MSVLYRILGIFGMWEIDFFIYVPVIYIILKNRLERVGEDKIFMYTSLKGWESRTWRSGIGSQMRYQG